MRSVTWQEVRDEALRRIRARDWAPGAQIPNEADLAAELGCSRTTVNRALRDLADAGWLERRRRAGTRVALAPQPRAQLAIPLIRQEIEARGQVCAHALIRHERAPMPAAIRAALSLGDTTQGWHTQTLYLADARPFAVEDRWVNPDAAPGYDSAPLDRMSPNEWLVRNVAFAQGTLDYGAEAADPETARHLGCDAGAAVMVLDRRTFGPDAGITRVRLVHAPGYRLRMDI